MVNEKAKIFFEELWTRGDPWELETSEFESAKYNRQFGMLEDRIYTKTLELGCGAGFFTRMLAKISEHIVAIDVSAAAIARARSGGMELKNIEYRIGNIMSYDPLTDGSWDLIVLSETIYYIGWLYPFFDVAMLASNLHAATNAGGRLIMANTFGVMEDYLLRPWIIRTYRDLFLNVGYNLEAEQIFEGTKNGANLEVLITLFLKNT